VPEKIPRIREKITSFVISAREIAMSGGSIERIPT